MKRVTIAEFGGSRRKIRVFTEGDLVRVQWRVNGALKTQSWPNTTTNRATAKAFARGVADAREAPKVTAPLTLRDLWLKFAEAEFHHLRPRTQEIYREYWNRWELTFGAGFNVEHTTLEMVHTFRAALAKVGLKTSTIGHTIRVAQMVYAWGERNELIERNRLRLYRFKVAKEDRPTSPPEYTTEEFVGMVKQLDPESATQWRAHCALVICGSQGARQNSVLHLQWTDIEGDIITWRAPWDKMGREWQQPIRLATKAALEVARVWRERAGYTGPWVFPAGSSKNKRKVYSEQSLWTATMGAEKRAGVAHLEGRAAHGLRKMFSGNIRELTGDAALAMQAIGDTDLRMATRYLKPRMRELTAAFGKLDTPTEAPK